MTMRADAEHDAVCESLAAHILVVAPPGTGKTCLSVRIAASVAPSLSASAKVLLVTFSNQAKVQIEREAARQVPPDLRKRIHVTNYHGFFWRAVWAHRRALGLPLDAQIVSRQRREQALTSAHAEIVRDLDTSNGLLDGLAEHRFVKFRDDRTPDEGALNQLLEVVQIEQRAGRLVFDDLGALFWKLLEEFPTLAESYACRYPVVIADEHQDASELQDSVVRRLGRLRRVIFADPMQLIYGFRGSNPERLDRHAGECGASFELNTPHRWRDDAEAGQWLLAVRRRLGGGVDNTPSPVTLKIVEANAAYGFNGVKPHVRAAASEAFAGGMRTVAVLAAWNSEVGELRAYLSREGMYPRQIGGSEDFEDARNDIEQLPTLTGTQAIALLAIDRVSKLVPTLTSSVINQVKGRLKADGINLSGCGAEARGVLQSLQPLYDFGSGQYVNCVVSCIDACSARGHHLPRLEAIRALQATAGSHPPNEIELPAVLARYAEAVTSASQVAPRLERGLFVMTAHQSKGKEFDAVILVNAGEAQFPASDEGRRLFYVAITRASKRWVVVAPNHKPSPLVRLLDAS
jgi:hypothetical protein